MLPNQMKLAVVLLLAFGLLAVRAATEEGSPRLDAQGDPLPDEAVSRLGTVRLRDGGYVNGLVFSPDGKTLISDGTDGVRTWDAATGRQLRHFDAKGFTLSPDGKLLALPFDGAIHLLEVKTDKEVHSFGSKATWYSALRFSSDGKKLAALSEVQMGDMPKDLFQPTNIRLEIWDAATGQKANSWIIGPPRNHWGAWLRWPAGNTPIVANYSDNALRLWDAATAKVKHELAVGELTADSGLVAFSPDGGQLAVICDDRHTRCLRIWNTATGKLTQELGAYKIVSGQWEPSKYLTVAAFAPDGKTLVTSSKDGTLIFWDAATGVEARRFALPEAQALAVSPDGKTLAAACAHAVHLFDLATGKDCLPPTGLQDSVIATAVSADGRTAATASEGSVVLWDAATGKELRRLEGLPDHVAGIHMAPDGRSLVTLGYDAKWQVHTLQTWRLPGGEELHRAEWRSKESSPSRFMALAPDGKTAAVGLRSYSKKMILLDRDAATVVRTIDLEKEYAQIYGAAFTDNRTVLVLSIEDRLVRLWDIATGRLLRHFRLVGAGYVAAVSPDGRRLVFGSQESFLALYDVVAGREIARTEKLGDNPNNGRLIAFSPDGRMFAWKGGDPRTVYLTETATLRERGRFIAPQGKITTLTFSADSRTLITGNSDTTALVWDLIGRLREKETWGKSLAIADLDACWSDLASADASQAYRGVQKLAGAAKDAGAYLKPRLRPVPALDEKRIARLIADLDNDDFDVREEATKELGKWEEAALSFYQKALDSTPPLEARRRLEALIDEQARRQSHPPAQRLQFLRALEVLERADTPDARGVLEMIAKGAPGAAVTDEAKASLERSMKRAEIDMRH